MFLHCSNSDVIWYHTTKQSTGDWANTKCWFIGCYLWQEKSMLLQRLLLSGIFFFWSLMFNWIWIGYFRWFAERHPFGRLSGVGSVHGSGSGWLPGADERCAWTRIRQRIQQRAVRSGCLLQGMCSEEWRSRAVIFFAGFGIGVIWFGIFLCES